jgi:hypothetical protein
MQVARVARRASPCVVKQQWVPSVVQLTGWSLRHATAEQAAPIEACSGVASFRPSFVQRHRPIRVAAAAAEAGDAIAEAEIGIHDVEELRGIRANLDSQEPVVEYRVHWKDGSPDTWCALLQLWHGCCMWCAQLSSTQLTCAAACGRNA